VVGTYRPDAGTLALMKKEGYADAQHRLELEADGRFAMIGMPDAWRTDGGRPEGRLDLDGGTWSLRRHQEWWGVEVQLKSRSALFPLSGAAPPYRIHVVLGDPDDGRAMIFERR
jgi:hypothetical protein